MLKAKVIVSIIHRLSEFWLAEMLFFVEDAVQPLLSCTKETGDSSGDVYDTLLPLFSGAQPPNEAIF